MQQHLVLFWLLGLLEGGGDAPPEPVIRRIRVTPSFSSGTPITPVFRSGTTITPSFGADA